MNTILETGSLPPRKLATGLFLGIAVVLALPSTTWAKGYELAAQSVLTNGLDTIGGSAHRNTGSSVHLHHDAGQGQSQAIGPSSPPSAPHRNSKPRL